MLKKGGLKVLKIPGNEKEDDDNVDDEEEDEMDEVDENTRSKSIIDIICGTSFLGIPRS